MQQLFLTADLALRQALVCGVPETRVYCLGGVQVSTRASRNTTPVFANAC
jgi:hypothetical protein